MSDGNKKILKYNHYEFDENPLYFVMLEMDTEQRMSLLCAFDIWYGDTDQDTDDYALEFAIVTRNIIHNGAVILNPKHLDITDVMDEFIQYLPGKSRSDYLCALDDIMNSK